MFPPMTIYSMHACHLKLFPPSPDTLVTTCASVPAVSRSPTLVTVHGAFTGRDTEDHNVLTGRMLTSASGAAKSALNYHSNQQTNTAVECVRIIM